MKWNLGAVLCAAAVMGSSACGPSEEDFFESSENPVHTVCGGQNTVPGIDVSTWQGTINWSAVKSAGIVFAITRVSHGTGIIDNQFAANWAGMKKVGIIRGVYQYFQPDQDALAQANLLINKVQAAGGFQSSDLPPVLDIEVTGNVSGAAAVKAADTWLTRIKKGANRIPMIYTGSYFWDDHSYGSSLDSYPLWTAHYTSASCPLVPNAWNSWKIWQYTSSGSVSGISGNVDRDHFNGTLTGLKQFIANSIISPPAPRPDAAVPRADAKTTRRDASRRSDTLESEADSSPSYGSSDGGAPPHPQIRTPPVEQSGGCSLAGPASPCARSFIGAALALILAGSLAWRRKRRSAPQAPISGAP